MSSKRCARCEKTVYPLEELKCLDKLWHKVCFKCQECGMTLNMKTYKGFNKQPYCNAHCPQAKHTAVADTPEIKRLAENTRLQSNVKYHADFEKAKGKFTQVADDPETLRIRNTTKIISNVSYHGELERKKQMEQKRHLVAEKNGVPINAAAPMPRHTQQQAAPMPHPTQQQAAPMPRHTQQQAAPMPHHTQQQAAPMPRHTQQQAAPMPRHTQQQAAPMPRHTQQQAAPMPRHTQQPHTPPGKILDYEPASAPEVKSSPYSAKLTSTVIYTSQEGAVHSVPSRKIGSIADYDPLNENYGSLATGYRTAGNMVGTGNMYQGREPVPSGPKSAGRSFRAMYDYIAQDSDEVSFSDGDIIINCNPIDEGWMTGTVQRTGHNGMLPANYVEAIN